MVEINPNWQSTAVALTDLGAVHATLDLYLQHEPGAWRFENPAAHGRLQDVTIQLRSASYTYGTLRVSRIRCADPQQEWRRELQVHLIGDAVNDALDNLVGGLRHQLVVAHLHPR